MSVLTKSTPESEAPAGDFDLLAPVEYVAPRANLLPPEIAERAALRRMQALLAAAVIACGGIVGAVYVNSASGRAPAKAALAQAQSEQQTLSAQKAALAPAQAAHQQVLAAKQSLQAAMGSEVLWSGQLDTLRRRLTDGVRLSTLTITPLDAASTGAASSAVQLPAGPAGTSTAASTATSTTTGSAASSTYIATVTMSGTALDNDAVADWLDTLAAMPGWGNVYLTTTATIAPPSPLVSYSITANITQAALSHRYTNGS
ncbi:MAG TPA: PilN domain-containing protein [Frankiaceae bacterium]|jgi:Tfp pilus assembly protein PilN|nr:PilN domain-containing protein [Frankiaceae bacterium]